MTRSPAEDLLEELHAEENARALRQALDNITQQDFPWMDQDEYAPKLRRRIGPDEVRVEPLPDDSPQKRARSRARMYEAELRERLEDLEETLVDVVEWLESVARDQTRLCRHEECHNPGACSHVGAVIARGYRGGAEERLTRLRATLGLQPLEPVRVLAESGSTDDVQGEHTSEDQEQA